MGKLFQAQRTKKQAGVAILIFNKLGLKTTGQEDQERLPGAD